MIWVGITGCMGCGKSTVAKILQENYGFYIISADDEAQRVLKEDQEVHDFVGHDLGIVYIQDFKEYKKKIADQIFGCPFKLAAFEKCIHPKVRSRVQKKKKELFQKEKMVFYEVPLLFEKNMEKDFDFIIAVISDKHIQIQRLKDRNQWSNEVIEKRLKYHKSCKLKIQKSHFVIFNNESLDCLKEKVQMAAKELFKKFDI